MTKAVMHNCYILLFLLAGCALRAQKTAIVVDPSGKGDFTTIQAAINSLPDSSGTDRIIRIKAGTYHEKIFITKHHITFEGEDRDRTIITQDIARDEWRCEHTDDWGVATLNVNGNDITLKNLTIANEYGWHQLQPRNIPCAIDTPTHMRTIRTDGHQMAMRTITATRLIAVNCRFKAYAGDTVSPWNLVNGMFYFKDCLMEGGVDFYCPRGWAWAENCKFFSNTGTAAIWHDGTGNPDYKTVLKNCSFDGFPGFQLGRYHRDAQFYLLDCRFSKNMADRDIYLVPTANTILWGRRVYFDGCTRDGEAYAWFANNLSEAAGAPRSNDITVAWLFKGQWQPDKK